MYVLRKGCGAKFFRICQAESVSRPPVTTITLHSASFPHVLWELAFGLTVLLTMQLQVAESSVYLTGGIGHQI